MSSHINCSFPNEDERKRKHNKNNKHTHAQKLIVDPQINEYQPIPIYIIGPLKMVRNFAINCNLNAKRQQCHRENLISLCL